MTIKQQGGIFGRNPTFNDVNVDGGLFVGDNVKVNIGDSQDMQLYHDGLNSIIEDAGSGNIEIRSNTAVIRKATNAENHIYCQSNGSVILYHDGVPKIYTQSYGASVSGNLAFDSGSGIDFSATSGTGTSELFSDYEEGSFTPSFTTSNADLTSGYATQSGSYTKIGNVVNCHGTLVLSSVSGGTGTLLITGLPYTVSLLRGGSTGFAYDWATHYPDSYINSGVGISPYYGLTATTYSSMSSANLNSTTQLYFFVSYITS